MAGKKVLGSLECRLIATKMINRNGDGVDVRLGPIRRGENDIIAGVEQSQRGDRRLVEILTDRRGTAATQTDLRRVRSKNENLSLAHLNLHVRGVRRR